MPYAVCPSCGLRVYGAAAYSGVDSCPRCGRGLPRRPGGDRNGLEIRYAAEALERVRRRSRRLPARSRYR
jgi:hypothetical protein